MGKTPGWEDSVKEAAEAWGERLSRLQQMATYKIPPLVPYRPSERIRPWSEAFIERLTETIKLWQQELPEDAQPLILTNIPGMGIIQVLGIWAEGPTEIGFKGMMGDTEVMLISHSSTLQIVLMVEKLEDPKQRYEIGFGAGMKSPD